jgi:serine/threonine-protein phosphatase 6 regulatory ankyrin repeat subunit B
MLAAKNGKSLAVQQLISANANPNIIADDGMTALLYAVKNNHIAVVDELIKTNVNIDQTDEYGWTALMIASMKGYTDIVEKLISANINVDSQSRGYRTALSWASHEGHAETVEQLLKANPRSYIRDQSGKSPLDYAKEKLNITKKTNYYKIVALLEQYQPPSYSILPKDGKLCQQAFSQQEQKPLFYAIYHDCAETVNKLLIKGTDPNTILSNGFTALNMTATLKKPIIAQLLIKANADINTAHPKYGITALMSASSSGSLEIVDLLLKAGANNIEAKDKYRENALMKAISNDHVAIVERLLESGASLDTTSRLNLNPLMQASLQSPEVVRFLISIGVDVNEQHKESGETALMKATQRGEHSIITLLTRAGARLDIQKKNGVTAMRIAKTR